MVLVGGVEPIVTEAGISRKGNLELNSKFNVFIIEQQNHISFMPITLKWLRY